VRYILIGRINDGFDTTQIGDNSNKSILSRGCDPEMGRRAIKLLPPVLGNPEMVLLISLKALTINYTMYLVL